ncbi:hypothetical protein BGZ54_003163 [Gamsiella multidivaricata]|nr:hypothetical protein BGZ54_003163 [Gamsiella multidivaricata]
MWSTGVSRKHIAHILPWVAAILALILVVSTPVHSIPVLQSRGQDDLYRRADPLTPNAPKKPNATGKKPQYSFEIFNPEPHDVWISGTIQSFSWADLSLPPGATFDITLIPVEVETNPEAKKITRRPILRYVDAMTRVLDFVVPYDLISRDQLIHEQEGDAKVVLENEQTTPEQDIYEDAPSIARPSAVAAPDDTTTDAPSPTQPPKNIRSLARLYFTAYEGRTNKILAQMSVFPIEIQKDHVRDQRTLLAPADLSSPIPGVDETTEELSKKDTKITHFGDHTQGVDQNQGTESEEDKDEDDVDDTDDEDDLFSELNGDDDDVTDTPAPEQMESGEDESVFMESNSTDIGHMGHDYQDLESEDEDEEGEGDEDEEMHHHGDHIMDPDHFENDEDVQLWQDHADDPGYNPPIKVIDAGMIAITHWIDNKERFFVGAPYVFGWEFPQDAKGLTGVVNVYVEDAFTAKRYDIAVGNLPSDIRFMYLRPTAIMMSASPKKRVYLRARVEMDLFKGGNIHRYTGFSKVFWVERGAL